MTEYFEDEQVEKKRKISKKTQTKAILAVAILMVAGIGAVFVTSDETTEEVDAFILTYAQFALILIIMFLAGMTVGVLAGMALTGDSQGETIARNGEANLVASSILQGAAYYTNNSKQISQIWELTFEHFVRYAELAAAFLWGPDVPYSANAILEESRAYYNGAVAITNSSAQTSQLFHQIHDRLDLWNTTPDTNAYAGKMKVSWVYGSTEFGSKTHFDGYLSSVVRNPTTTNNKVYISDSANMWVEGGSATITDEMGSTKTLSNGWNNLTSSGFKPGIYTLQGSRTYAGPIMRIIDPQAAPVLSGVVMEADTQTRIAINDTNSGGVMIDGVYYSGLSIRVSPDSGTPQTVSVTSVFKNMQTMMGDVGTTMMYANAAASAVWNLYDIAGESSVFITTLLVPDKYHNIDINAAQKSLLTAVAMVQLGNFLSAHKEQIDATDFKLTSDSMTLFCRGDIYKNNGEILYKNVIFTPLFYTKDVTLTTGNNVTNQNALIAIWDRDKTLSSWSFTSSTKIGEVPPLHSGGSIYIYEMKYGANFVNSVFLELRDIDIIDPEKWDQVKPVDPGSGKDDIFWAIVMIIAGVVLIMIAAVVAPLRPLMYLGIILIILGFVMYVMSTFSIWSLIGLFTFPAVMPKGTGGSGMLFDRGRGSL